MEFSSVPVRLNGETVFSSWWNLLRTAGVDLADRLADFVGGGAILETTFTIANNNAGPSNVTGLLFDSANYKSAHILVTLRRKTDSGERIATGWLHVYYLQSTSSWALIDSMGGTVEDDGVEFSITSGGQVRYSSDNMAGANYSGSMSFRAFTSGV